MIREFDGRFDGRSLLEAVRKGEAPERYVYSETRLPLDLHGWSMLSLSLIHI